MLIFYLKMIVPFVNGVQNLDLGSNFNFFLRMLGVFLEKLKGESDKVEILVTGILDHLQQKSPK